jgi:hypothetical protein
MTRRQVTGTRMRWLLFAGFLLVAAGGPRMLNGETKKMTPGSPYLVYVGTYTATGSKGVYNYRFDPHSGKLTPIGVAAEQANPSFMATDPQHRFLSAAT